jgi:hypothetical protein
MLPATAGKHWYLRTLLSASTLPFDHGWAVRIVLWRRPLLAIPLRNVSARGRGKADHMRAAFR